ncbi:alpha/beta fold hydrolase [Rhodococcus spelaei]|uniref:Alpha/beta fold hydrolase n=1 Tax=Rhodococcus spelaei TaxID=2546320 RepID=A0A541BRV8_9NOCA|nr:alpha/beta fold hydrolase [Rhodococcus spelaei]TQF75051.1 alpha/beta fold hydrolase [Rhodococcus spelaei]
MRGRIVFGALISAATFFLGAGTSSAAPPPLPVPYQFLAGVPLELGNPGGSAPGSNDWSCKPTAQHPEPVVLVHGTGGNRQTNWATYAPLLANEGYCVFALTYGAHDELPWPISAIGAMRPMEQSAQELSDFVDRVLAATGASKVDIIGHSQGTLMPNYWVKFLGGADKVDKYVSLAPLWHGEGSFDLDKNLASFRKLGVDAMTPGMAQLCGACSQMIAGSTFMARMQAGGVYAPGVTYTNIITRYDDVVIPYMSGYQEGPNATNIFVQDHCSQDYGDHLSIAGEPVAAALVLNALDPAHQRPVPCVFVPPVVG